MTNYIDFLKASQRKEHLSFLRQPDDLRKINPEDI